MSRSRTLLFLLLLLLAGLLVAMPARPAKAATRHPVGEIPGVRLVSPLADERVPESIARIEVELPAQLGNARIVVSRQPFDARGWTDLPAGAQWAVAPLVERSLPIAALHLDVHVETTLWWAVLARERTTGTLRASETRRLVLVPRFANRFGAAPEVRPSALGRLAPLAAGASGPPTFRAIALTSGVVVAPGPQNSFEAMVSPNLAAAGRTASLVQFADAPPESARAIIGRAGGRIVGPMDGASWLVRMDAGERARLAADPSAPWVGDWQPAYKQSPEISALPAGAADLTVLLFPDGDDAAVAAALRAMGASGVRVHRGSLNRIVEARLDPARVAGIAALPDVEWIEPAPRDSVLNDQAQWVTQTGTPGSRRLWDMGLLGQGQVVMTADSGIRTTHELFFDSTTAIPTWGNYPNHRKVIAYLPGSDDPRVAFGDEAAAEYHGTHTAGTVAGNADNSSGAPWTGMAKEAKLFFMDMAGPSLGGGLAPPADLNDLFLPSYVGNSGGAARLSSNSWGQNGGYGYYTVHAMTIDQFMWAHPDYLVAFAAGNVGVLGAVQPPGTAKDCLTVGAVGNGADMIQLAPFSSRGPTRDLRYKPTVMAPGVDVTSSIGSTRFTYAAYSGTSMATPAATGTLALMREYLAEGWYPGGTPVPANAMTPSAALLKAMSIGSARNNILGYSSPSFSTGWGRLTADDVLYFAGDSTHLLLVDGKDGLEDRQYVEYQVQVTDPSRPLKIVLCWTDAPGNPASALSIVNDLDLLVTHNGTTYLGNHFLSGNTGTGGPRDSLNVEEVARFAAPEEGLWTVRVEAHRVLQGPQPFAMCITGGVATSAGTIALDRFEYGLADTLGIEVVDPNATSPLAVQVSSPSDQYGETVLLTGSGGLFRGRVAIAPAVPRPFDGVLSVSSGDDVTATYEDGSPPVVLSAHAPVNAHAPVITDVHAAVISGTSAVVSWATDVPSSSRVTFGTSAPVAYRDSAGLVTQHAVLLTGLAPATTHRYDVSSATRTGSVTTDSLGGLHRAFTTRQPGDLALLMDDPSPVTRATWENALAKLGWRTDVIERSDLDPPLVGDATAGLRRYSAVLWQVDPDRYPPFSDAQRGAIDSLLNGGGRLLVTGHDMGWGTSDMSSPSYSLDRETWFEQGLKTRYYYDVSWVDTLSGVAGDPVTGAFTGGVKYFPGLYPDAGDAVAPAPGTDGSGVRDWLNDNLPQAAMGIRWESSAPKGTPGTAVWGGSTSRLAGLYYEWRALGSLTSDESPDRTAVLERAADWLLGRRPPQARITSPAPGAVVTADFLPILYTVQADSGRTITNRKLWFSLDGGESWQLLTDATDGVNGIIWDLGAVLGGPPVPNSTRVLLKLQVTDDGTPAMHTETVLAGTFTLVRGTGDLSGPTVVAGTAGTSPSPMRRGMPCTLSATLSDAETGGSTVAAAEWSAGASAALGGTGHPMSGAFGAAAVAATASVSTLDFAPGSATLWVRGRDAAGNWGPASGFAVLANDAGVAAADGPVSLDFLAPATPNPSRGGASSLRFGLARGGPARLEVFDLAGRRLRTLAEGLLAAGPHVAVWDGRDGGDRPVNAGVYFVRLELPGRTFHSRLVRLD